MAELGGEADAGHRAVAAEAGALGIDVIAVDAPAYGAGATHVHGIAEALQAIGSMTDGDAVLVKGSRVAGLERLASALVEGTAPTV